MKKIRNKVMIFSILLLLIIVLHSITKAITVQFLEGDINKDNVVNTSDLLFTLRHIFNKKTNKKEEWKLSEEQQKLADINNDDKIDITDVLWYYRYIAANKNDSINNKHPEWKEQIKTKKLELKEEFINLQINESKKLELITENIEKLEYKSNNQEIVEIDSQGMMTAKKEGETQIQIIGDEILMIQCEIKVQKQDIKITNIILEKDEIELNLDNMTKAKIGISIEPQNASNQTLVWESENTAIATVDSQGNVTAQSKGETNIKVKTTDGSNIEKKCHIVVLQKETVKVESISLNTNNVEIDLAQSNPTVSLVATIYPNNADNKEIEWESSNTNIATINQNGVVTGKEEGICTITVRSKENSKIIDTCKITVKRTTNPEEPVKVENISLNTNNTEIDLAQTNPTVTLVATVYPNNADNKEVEWESSNTDIATVNENGIVTGKQEGTCTITVKSVENNNIKATCQIVVKKTIIPVTSISLNLEEARIDLTKQNKTLNLVATIYPSNATNKEIEWEASDEERATVSQTGLVTGIKEGTCIITAKSKDNENVTAKCTILVSRGMTLIPSTEEYLDVINKSMTLTANQSSNDAETVNWEIEDETIASISSNTGDKITVTRKKAGNTVITASTASGKKVQYNLGVKQEKIIYTGASGTELMAKERKDGDTGNIQNIDYGTLQKNKDLFFIAKSGAGILWYLSDSQRETILSKGTYFSQTYKTSIPYANTKIEDLISSEDLNKVHISVAFLVEGNDIKRAGHNKTYLENQAIVYGNYLEDLAKKHPKITVYVISKGAYDPDSDAGKNYNEDCKIFNTKLTAIVNESWTTNLLYKKFYTYCNDLWTNDSKANITADGHPNEYATQKMFNKILEFLQIDPQENRSNVVVNTKIISQRKYSIIADSMLKSKMNL